MTVRLGRWMRRNKTLVSSAAAALLVMLVAIGVGAVWYQRIEGERYAEQIRREAEEKRRLAQVAAEKQRQRLKVETEIRQALTQAKDARGALIEKLTKSGGVFQLLNNPAEWQRQIQTTQGLVKQAKALIRNSESLVAKSLENQVGKLERELRQDEADRKLALRVEKIREQSAIRRQIRVVQSKTVAAYRNLFAEQGMKFVVEDLISLSKHIRGSLIREELVAALDGWALALWRESKDRELFVNVLRVARLADPHPVRDRIRSIEVWRDRRAVEELAKKLRQPLIKGGKARRLSPQMWQLVGYLLDATGGDALSWLRAAQFEYPTDFWLNMELADALHDKNPQSAIGFLRAALAVRPDSSAAHNNLAFILGKEKDHKAAIRHGKKAFALDPGDLYPHINLSSSLYWIQDYDGAMWHAKKALEIDPQCAKAHVNLGNVHYKKANPKEAARLYRAALKINPKLPQANNNLGAILAEMGELNEAVSYLQKGLAITPTYPNAHTNLASALLKKRAFAEAMRHVKAAIALKPDHAIAYFIWGEILMAKNDLDHAIEKIQKGLQLAPHYVTAHCHLGRAYKKKQDWNRAIASFRKALKIDAGSAWAHNLLGDTLRIKGDLKGATRHLKQALQISPKYADAHYYLGRILYDTKDYKKAIEHFREVVAIDPKDADAHFRLGLAFSATKARELAIRHYTESVRLQPDLYIAQYNLAESLRFKKDLAGATRHFKQAIAAKPDFARAYLQLGITHRMRGDLENAARAYRKVIETDPSIGEAYANLGSVLEAKGELDEAFRLHQKAIAVNPRLAMPYYNSGNILKAKNDFEGAIRWYRRAIAVRPTYAEAHCNLGHQLRELGRFAEALESLRRSHELFTARGDRTYPTARWVKHCAHLLQLDEKLKAIDEGKTKPRDAGERLALADLCARYRKRYVQAVHFYCDAFAQDKKLTANVSKQYRYHAACVAALAAAGQGKDDGKLTERELIQLRHQALNWLEADLKVWREHVKRGKPLDIIQVAEERLPQWLDDPDLSSIRDKEYLAKLPEEEQTICRELWANVENVRKQVQSRYTKSSQKGTLTESRKQQRHPLKMTAGATYVIELQSKQFDTFLTLEDGKGNKKAEHDDLSKGNRNSRIIFRATESSVYSILVGSYQNRGRGDYTLSVREFPALANATPK